MAAHALMVARGFPLELLSSYGTSDMVRLPSVHGVKPFPFGRGYGWMLKTMMDSSVAEAAYVRSIGLVELMQRNATVKHSPESWYDQDCAPVPAATRAAADAAALALAGLETPCRNSYDAQQIEGRSSDEGDSSDCGSCNSDGSGRVGMKRGRAATSASRRLGGSDVSGDFGGSATPGAGGLSNAGKGKAGAAIKGGRQGRSRAASDVSDSSSVSSASSNFSDLKELSDEEGAAAALEGGTAEAGEVNDDGSNSLRRHHFVLCFDPTVYNAVVADMRKQEEQLQLRAAEHPSSSALSSSSSSASAPASAAVSAPAVVDQFFGAGYGRPEAAVAGADTPAAAVVAEHHLLSSGSGSNSVSISTSEAAVALDPALRQHLAANRTLVHVVLIATKDMINDATAAATRAVAFAERICRDTDRLANSWAWANAAQAKMQQLYDAYVSACTSGNGNGSGSMTSPSASSSKLLEVVPSFSPPLSGMLSFTITPARQRSASQLDASAKFGGHTGLVTVTRTGIQLPHLSLGDGSVGSSISGRWSPSQDGHKRTRLSSGSDTVGDGPARRLLMGGPAQSCVIEGSPSSVATATHAFAASYSAPYSSSSASGVSFASAGGLSVVTAATATVVPRGSFGSEADVSGLFGCDVIMSGASATPPSQYSGGSIALTFQAGSDVSMTSLAGSASPSKHRQKSTAVSVARFAAVAVKDVVDSSDNDDDEDDEGEVEIFDETQLRATRAPGAGTPQAAALGRGSNKRSAGALMSPASSAATTDPRPITPAGFPLSANRPLPSPAAAVSAVANAQQRAKDAQAARSHYERQVRALLLDAKCAALAEHLASVRSSLQLLEAAIGTGCVKHALAWL